MPQVVLYASIASRSLTAFWLLEELGIPYEWRDTDLKARKHRSPEYLALNPTGRVPAIAVDGVVISERPAICLYLADRFSYGELAPRIEEPERGPYLRWIVYASAALDPAIAIAQAGIPPLRHATWNSLEDVVQEIGAALEGKAWLLGARFSAADVMLGSVVAMASFNRQLPANAGVSAYADRIMARPAMQRAVAKTFPPQAIAEARRSGGS